MAFICLREFRDAALQPGGRRIQLVGLATTLPFLTAFTGRVWILHGPTVVAEASPGSPSLFLGRLAHTPEGLPKFITSQVPCPPHAALVTCCSLVSLAPVSSPVLYSHRAFN